MVQGFGFFLGALRTRIGAPLKGVYKGYYEGSISGQYRGLLITRIGAPLKGVYKGYYEGIYKTGALIIRIGFWSHFTIVTIRSPQNSVGNFLGPLHYGYGFRVLGFGIIGLRVSEVLGFSLIPAHELLAH